MKYCIVSIFAALVLTGFFLYRSRVKPPQAMGQDAYIWQRVWSDDMVHSANNQQHHFRRFVILASELSPRSDPPEVVLIHPDYRAVSHTVHEIGLAIRVGAMAGTGGYEPESAQTKALCSLAIDAIADARAAGLAVCELQIDYDCPASKLSGYKKWIQKLKTAVSPVPVVITALPSWLTASSFSDLAREAGAFVIQVHSLQRPSDLESPVQICDPAQARLAVDRASKCGVAFRVALPTYSYLAAFGVGGKFIGLSAEGRLPEWAAGTQLRTLRSDPTVIAPLLAEWIAHPPANMTGIIWYRLPIPSDALNWSPTTLQTVMAGQIPLPHLLAQTQVSKPGLVEIVLKNDGNDDAFFNSAVLVSADEPIEIAEAISGFVRLDGADGNVTFRDGSNQKRRIAPGERVQIGWVRVSTNTEVQAHVISAPP